MIQVDRGRFTSGHARRFCISDSQPVPIANIMPIGQRVPAAANLDAMVQTAEALGRPFDFMRVDLYSTRGKVWLGELTPYPASGTIQYEPRQFDAYLAGRWSLPSLGAVTSITHDRLGATPDVHVPAHEG